MKKSILFSFLALLLTIEVSSQEVEKDSIMSFFDKKGDVTTNKKKARTFEILTKVNDTLWLARKFRRNGELFHYIHYKSRDKKVKIGQSVTYNKNGKIVSMVFFNNKGEKHGKMKSWFDNGNKSVESIYLNGKREGIWRYYHYNEKLAARGVFKKDSLIKSNFYTELGEEVYHDCPELKLKKPIFKGGINKYKNYLKTLVKEISFKVKGKVNIHYTIHIDGSIRNVTIDEKLPLKLEKQIIRFFEKIKGWSPATHMNRLVPMNYSQPLNFKE